LNELINKIQIAKVSFEDSETQWLENIIKKNASNKKKDKFKNKAKTNPTVLPKRGNSKRLGLGLKKSSESSNPSRKMSNLSKGSKMTGKRSSTPHKN
jgi:hypothetical protein